MNRTLGELLTELRKRLDMDEKSNPILTSFLQEAHDIMYAQLNPTAIDCRERPRFTYQTDISGVSDRLVLLYALALAKSHYRHPDAQVAVSACTNLLRLEKIRQHQNRRAQPTEPEAPCVANVLTLKFEFDTVDKETGEPNRLTISVSGAAEAVHKVNDAMSRMNMQPVPPGHVVVPLEPTEEMELDAYQSLAHKTWPNTTAGEIYRAMIAAAKKEPDHG